MLIIALKAPIPSVYRPITDMKRYYRLKSVSITIALFWCLLLSEGYLDSTKSSIGIVTISLQAMQLFKRNIKKGGIIMQTLKKLKPIYLVGLLLVGIARLTTFGGSYLLFHEPEVPESLKK